MCAGREELLYEKGIFFVFYPVAHGLGLLSLGGAYLLSITRLGLLAQLLFACPTPLAEIDFRESLVKKVAVDYSYLQQNLINVLFIIKMK